MKSFSLTAFPILTTLASLGFAFYEKYEKGVVQDSLVQTEGTLTQTRNRLEVAEVQSWVAEEAVDKLTQMVPRVYATRSVRADGDPDLSNQVIKTAEQEVLEIEKEVANLNLEKALDKVDLRRKFQTRIEAKTELPIFHPER